MDRQRFFIYFVSRVIQLSLWKWKLFPKSHPLVKGLYMERGYSDMSYKFIVAAQCPLPPFSLVIRTSIFCSSLFALKPMSTKAKCACAFWPRKCKWECFVQLLGSISKGRSVTGFLPRHWLWGLGALASIWDSEVMGHIWGGGGVAEVLAGQILCLEDLGEQDHACPHCLPLGSFSILCKPLPTWAFWTWHPKLLLRDTLKTVLSRSVGLFYLKM